jgi:hypothetical protein
VGRDDPGGAVSQASFLDVAGPPAAVLSDGIVTVPLWAVNSLALTEAYQLPPVGSAGMRAVSQVHDDTLTISAMLVGPSRFAWKLALEQLAESSRRGTALAALSARIGARVGGLVLVTPLTIRTDIQVQSLSFTANAGKRDALDVQLTLVHLPLPSLFGKLLEVGDVLVQGLRDATS